MSLSGDKSPTGLSADPAQDMVEYPFKFTGTPGAFFNIWIVNLFLTILTLGIYSAWAKVRTQRYFYANTSLDNTSFQYLADPIDVLKGRLVAVGVLVAYLVLSMVMPALEGIFFLVVILLFPWFIIRSFAFRYRYSVYRGIHFHFSPDLRGALRAFILWPAAGILTLGLLFPVSTQRQAQFIVNNSRYGTSKFTFNGAVRDYYRLCLVTLGCALVIVLIGTALWEIAGAGWMVFFSVPLWLLVYYNFSMMMTRLFFNSTVVGPHRFECHYDLKSYALLQIINAVGITFSLGLLIPWAKVRAARYRAEHTRVRVYGGLDDFVARERESVSALGDEALDLFDMEIGIG